MLHALIHIQISLIGYVGPMLRSTAVATASFRVPLRVQWGYSDATVTLAAVHPVAAEYPHSTLNGILTCSSHIGTALYKTHVAGQKESGCVYAIALVLVVHCCLSCYRNICLKRYSNRILFLFQERRLKEIAKQKEQEKKRKKRRKSRQKDLVLADDDLDGRRIQELQEVWEMVHPSKGG